MKRYLFYGCSECTVIHLQTVTLLIWVMPLTNGCFPSMAKHSGFVTLKGLKNKFKYSVRCKGARLKTMCIAKAFVFLVWFWSEKNKIKIKSEPQSRLYCCLCPH